MPEIARHQATETKVIVVSRFLQTFPFRATGHEVAVREVATGELFAVNIFTGREAKARKLANRAYVNLRAGVTDSQRVWDDPAATVTP